MLYRVRLNIIKELLKLINTFLIVSVLIIPTYLRISSYSSTRVSVID